MERRPRSPRTRAHQRTRECVPRPPQRSFLELDQLRVLTGAAAAQDPPTRRVKYAGRAFVVRVFGYSGVRNRELCDLRVAGAVEAIAGAVPEAPVPAPPRHRA